MVGKRALSLDFKNYTLHIGLSIEHTMSMDSVNKNPEKSMWFDCAGRERSGCPDSLIEFVFSLKFLHSANIPPE